MKKTFALILTITMFFTFAPITIIADSVGDNVTKVISLLRKGSVSQALSYNQLLPEYASESCVSKMTGAMKAAYKEKVKSWEYAKLEGTYAFRDYWLTDIDNDGAAELLLNLVPSYAGAETYVYKYNNGTLTAIGVLSGNESCHAYPDHNGIVTEGGKMGYNWLSLVTVENGKLVTESLISYGDGYLNWDEYFNMRNQLKSHSKWNGEKYVPDYEVLEENTQYRFRSDMYSKEGMELPIINFNWSFDKLKDNSFKPQKDLAVLSILLSANVYDFDLIQETFNQLGFTNIYIGNKDYEGDIDRVGYAIASTKQIINGQNTNIIAVACRGSTGSLNLLNIDESDPDWRSNVKNQIEGFRAAAENVKKGLDAYISNPEYEIDRSLPTRILLTGHSRGGAVANILGTKLSYITSDDKVYVYTFACPNTTVLNEDRGHFSNIYNVIVDGDPVPFAPPITFPTSTKFKFGDNTILYADVNNSAFKTVFKQLTGGVSPKALDSDDEQCVCGYPLPARHHVPAVYMACLLKPGLKYSGSSRLYDVIRTPELPSVTILAPKANVAKRSATIKWKKLSAKNLKSIQKVQIQYCIGNQFKSDVKTVYSSAKNTSKTIKNLKKGRHKYYVRIRAYTVKDGDVYVSKWSGTKTFVIN